MLKIGKKGNHHNELEANQVQVSSLVLLNHMDGASKERIEEVRKSILELNSSADIQLWDDLDSSSLLNFTPSKNQPKKMDHAKTHWSSCSVDLPDPIIQTSEICSRFTSENILRVKGCTKLDRDPYYSYFERVPSGEVSVEPYTGDLITGFTIVSDRSWK